MIRATWLAFGLVACMGDDNDDVESGIVDDPNIVEVAQGDDNFSTLVDLLVRADLVDTLSGPGPFTVFAPTNDAFSGVDASALTDEELTQILTYHVVSGEVDSASIPALSDTVAGLTVFFDTSSGVQVNDATVTEADISASNGIIHVIDGVLLPPDILTAAGFAGLSGLAGAIDAADDSVATTLAGEGPFTVFAPTNDAFTAAANDIPTDPAEIADILFYHAVTAEVDSANIPATPTDAANGLSLFFDTSSGVVVNDATVQIADIRTTNGIVHVIDGVLSRPNIVDAAGFAGLTELIDTVGLADPAVLTALTGEGPLTVFAPTNQAFTDAPAPANVTETLLYHAYPGSFDSASLPAKADSALQTAFPDPTNVSALISTDGGASINGASVVIADVRTTNGIVHVIDDVLSPPTIVDLAGIAGLNSLAGALNAAPAPNPGDLVTLLGDGAGPFTVFAPTDDAFANAPAVTGQDLTNVLLFHVVDTSVASPVLEGDLTDGEVPTALGGVDTITVDTTAGTVEGANLVITDVNGTNGTVHVIDAVMIPPSFN